MPSKAKCPHCEDAIREQLERHADTLRDECHTQGMLAHLAQARVAALEEALGGLLEHYLRLANSGDCGNFDPETDPEVIAVRETLKEEQ